MSVEIDHEFFRQLEEKLHRQDIRASRDAVSARLADEFVEFGSSGRVYNKNETLAALEHDASSGSQPMDAYDFSVRQIAPDVVLVLYKTHRPGSGISPDTIALRSSIWKLSDGEWKLLFHQGTAVPPH